MTLAGGDVTRLSGLLAYQEGSVVSRQLVKNASGGVTLFAFAQGEGLSEHTTPHTVAAPEAFTMLLVMLKNP